MTEVTRKVHFISGLPRSGSTLLAALLNQNPRFHVTVQSPLADVFSAVLRSMSAAEGSLFITEEQRRRILSGIISSYYAHLPSGVVIFDTSRSWCALVNTLDVVVEDFKVICCVRNLAWILDSMERLIQRNALVVPKIFDHNVTSVFARVEAMMGNQLVRASLQGLRQAWCGEQADHLVGLQYDSLANRPGETMKQLYAMLDEPYFGHDFENVSYEAQEFDARLGVPGLHTVNRRVAPTNRPTILPAEIFAQHDLKFWEEEGSNPRGIVVI